MPPEFASVPVHTNFEDPTSLFAAIGEHLRTQQHWVHVRRPGVMTFWCVSCGNTYDLSVESYRRWLSATGTSRQIISTLMSIIIARSDTALLEWGEAVLAIDPVSVRPRHPSVFDHLMSEDE